MNQKIIKCKTCGAEIAKDAKICPKCGAKNKKRFSALRIILGIFLVFIGIGLFSQALGGGGHTASGSASAAQSSTSSVQADTTVTMDEFDAVQTGMTYEEVVDVIGFDGELGSQVDIGAGSEYKTEIYTWSNPLGSNMNATFQGGKLVSKAQFGLN